MLIGANRRGFLLGAGATLVALPLARSLSGLPILYGDGVNDDTAGLSALLSGQPFKSLGGDAFTPLFEDGWAALRGGEFRVTAPVIATAARIELDHARLIFEGPAHLSIADTAASLNISNCILDLRTANRGRTVVESYGFSRNWLR